MRTRFKEAGFHKGKMGELPEDEISNALLFFHFTVTFSKINSKGGAYAE